MKKRVASWLMLVVALVASFMASPSVDAYAAINRKQIKTKKEKEKNFSEYRDDYKYIDKMIKDEQDNYTGIVNKKMEKYLNEQGVFDNEIENINEDTIEHMNSIDDMENYYISTQVYAVNDAEKLKDEPIMENEMVELTNEQVDKYISETYYNIDTDLDEEIMEEFKGEADKTEKILSAFNIQTIDAYAATKRARYTNIDDNNGVCYLKKTMMLYKYSDSEFIKVDFITEWTTMPKYRQVDCSVLSWDDRAYWTPTSSKVSNQENIVITHYWKPIRKYTKKNGEIGLIIEDIKEKKVNCYNLGNGNNKYNKSLLKYNELITGKSTGFENETYIIGQNAIFVWIRLQNNTSNYSYFNEGVSMSFYLVASSHKYGPTFYTSYYHTWLVQKIDYEEISEGVMSIVTGTNYIGSAISSIKIVDGLTRIEYEAKYNLSGVTKIYPFTYVYAYK